MCSTSGQTCARFKPRGPVYASCIASARDKKGIVQIVSVLSKIDATSSLAEFLVQGGKCAQQLLKCEAAFVMLVSLGGSDAPIVRVGESVQEEAGKERYRIVAASAADEEEEEEERRRMGKGLAVLAARSSRCRKVGSQALGNGKWGVWARKGSQASVLAPEIDLMGLQGGAGRTGRPESVSSVLCAPWPLDVDLFYRSNRDSVLEQNELGRGGAGGKGASRARREAAQNEDRTRLSASENGVERLALVVVAVNREAGLPQRYVCH